MTESRPQEPTAPRTAPSREVDAGVLFEQHAAFLLRVVERLSGRGGHVEDVVQEVFLTAHRRRAELDPDADLRGWLYRVAVNLIHHHRRAFARRRALSERIRTAPASADPDLPDAALSRREQAQRVRKCVMKLPLKQREVFVLFELEGLEGQEVAQLMDIPENTVWTRLHHGRRRFEKLWRSTHGSRR